MRWIFHILILAIFISGYAAAAHAFGPVSGDQGQVQIAGVVLCADCQNDNSGNAQDQDDGASGTCMNCHHCCAGHIGFLPSSSIDFFKFSNILAPYHPENVASDYTFSLLRPPRILV